MDNEKQIYVYADFLSHKNELVGKLYTANLKGRDFFSFEYDSEWLYQCETFLDPDLKLYKGRQYLNNEKNIFGIFADSCPDRWGRLLMKRREELRARENNEKPRKLAEVDFLLGVYDEGRMGALRFKDSPEGEFLSNDKDFATPPWMSLRKLEHATNAFENDSTGLQAKWLKQLLAPGSSLGGARPKASVMAPDDSLWIAKFPSKHDDWNIGAWEMVTHELAQLCGLNVPEAKLENFSKQGSTFLVKRFDRDKDKRIHFSSAMTMLGKNDGADASTGNSYLEMVSFLRANGAKPKEDLLELWKRIVFSMAVSNTDDHFRNHGFILSNSGWRLSPLYDVNPDIYGNELSLNVDAESSSINFDLALSASAHYGLDKNKATNEITNIKNTIHDNWRKIAKNYDINRGEIERISPAFSECIPH